MTDDQIWYASLVAGALGGLAYTAALPRIETAATWNRRMRIGVGIAIFLLTSAAGRIAGHALSVARRGALTTSRDVGRDQQNAFDTMEESFDAIEGR